MEGAFSKEEGSEIIWMDSASYGGQRLLQQAKDLGRSKDRLTSDM